jgi:dimeric dUTPase (all-alpha-NTP-PPase superfamily)
MTEDRLTAIFELQSKLQREKFRDPARMNRTEAIEFIRWNTLALTDELHEALQEVGWKPWASSTHINREEFVGELVDAMHFLVNLFLVVGATPEEVHDRYAKKNAKNHTRQETGYTGLEKDEHGREID